MTSSSARPIRIICVLFVFQILLWPSLCAQTPDKNFSGTVEGTVRDSQNHPLSGVSIFLGNTASANSLRAITDSQGRFRLEAIAAGNYKLRAQLQGFREATIGPFGLLPQETKSVVLILAKVLSQDASAFSFADEPHFTVAGVTDTTALGGHGSDQVMRNSEALSKDAASLSGSAAHMPSAATGEATETSLRASLAAHETADTHFQLAEIEEQQGHPLEAVRDYQWAAELQPTEPHLFAWGAELLLHRASEPAAEVFTNGRNAYPQSIRMRLGLGAAAYAEGRRDEAAKLFMEASDLDPSDAKPYLFLGKLQATEKNVSPGWVQHMERFVKIHPGNALAHCLYAEALAKLGREQEDSALIESQLKTAIALDPRLGSAYLQLGIIRSQREDYLAAIAAFQKAIENTTLPDEAHYRLADVYRRIGQTDKANQETELFKKVSVQKKMQADRERREIQQFVYTLRRKSAESHSPSPNH
jgi:tetratricopeptide (TPR) repeat protein